MLLVGFRAEVPCLRSSKRRCEIRGGRSGVGGNAVVGCAQIRFLAPEQTNSNALGVPQPIHLVCLAVTFTAHVTSGSGQILRPSELATGFPKACFLLTLYMATRMIPIECR
jgi:hypothetical protein